MHYLTRAKIGTVCLSLLLAGAGRAQDPPAAAKAFIGGTGPDWVTLGEEDMYVMCEEAKKIFAEHYFSKEKDDLFYVIITELQNKWRDKVLQKEGERK